MSTVTVTRDQFTHLLFHGYYLKRYGRTYFYNPNAPDPDADELELGAVHGFLVTEEGITEPIMGYWDIFSDGPVTFTTIRTPFIYRRSA